MKTAQRTRSPAFVIGQRWISNTQSELGLGMVTQTDHRFVTISFPAAGEQRVYAMDNAPLSRVIYRVGDQVRSIDEEEMTVSAIHDQGGYLTYEGFLTDSSEVTHWGEVELDCFVQFSQPQERLFAGQIDRLDEYQLRYRALEHAHNLTKDDSTTGLLGPRVQLLPHQFYIASEVGQRFAPRVLLADEVGLGKTIEAGMIIHRQLLRGTCQRVLIVVPETLIHQWLVEMLRRFNLSFTLLNEERLKPSPDEEFISNPFEDAQLILCSLQTLTRNEDYLRQASESSWDLLVVDEAHHLQWQPEKASLEYETVEQLSAVAKGLLLLTATPEQLGLTSHFARLRLLDPDRYFDLEQFLQEQQGYQKINQLLDEVQRCGSLRELRENSQTMEALQDLLGPDFDGQLEDSPTALSELTTQLLDCHGTGRVLFRNTRAAVQGFPTRRLHTYSLPEDDSSSLAEQPKVRWLVEWLKSNRQEKVLLICADTEFAIDLELHLSLRAGVRSAVFHEGLSLIERDRAAAYFADAEDGAQLLVCSEIGSEGRNFQFAHHLVLFDLPDNPDLLEQRIGRLDRIGQTSDVNIHVPTIENSEESRRLRWYHEGLNALTRVCPVGHQVYEELYSGIESSLKTGAGIDELIVRTHERTTQLMQTLSEGRDKLLELNSCRQPVADNLVAAMSEKNDAADLAEFMESAFDIYGVESEKITDTTLVIRPSDHMKTEHFPGLLEDGVTATYCRETALARDDMQFLTWEHPMVQGVIDMLVSGEMGNTTLCTMRLKALKPGTVLLETGFRLSCAAPKSLQLSRFIDGHLIRLLTDSEKRNLEDVISNDQLGQLVQPLKRATAKQLMQQARGVVEKILQHAEQRAQDMLPSLIEAATESMQRFYQSELNRLQTLAARNPSIRQEEFDQVNHWQQQSLERLSQTGLTLEAMRVIVVVD